MDFIGILIFFVVAIASLAQKARENRKAKQANNPLAQRRDQRQVPAKRDESTVRQAKPKGASSGPSVALSPETTGGELIKALFGEGAVDSNEGWTAVEPEPRRELPRHRQQPAPRQPNEGGTVRDAVIRQREGMQRTRADHPARAHHHDKHRSPQQQQPSREQVVAERQRRKEQARQHREKAVARQKQQTQQQRRAPRPVAPVAQPSFVPQTLNDVRRAIVMAEILGPPKAYEDR